MENPIPPIENPTPPEVKPYTRLEWLQLTLFWSWNLIFLAFMSFGFAPVILPEIFTSVRIGVTPVQFLLFGLVLASIPVVVVILGLTALRRSPGKAFALAYVVEGPLMLILAVRFFAIRQATPATVLLMVIALGGMAAFAWYLLDSRAGQRQAWVEALRLGGLTLMALTSLYAALWIAFYAIPIAAMGLRWLGSTLAHLPSSLGNLIRDLRYGFGQQLIYLPMTILGFLLLVYTATLFVLAPVAVPYLSVKAWLKSFRAMGGRFGMSRPAILSGVVAIACTCLFIFANRQPQARAFAWLEKPPATIEEAQALLDRSESIREGLLNAYLAPFRYISAQGEVRHVSDLYASALRIPDSDAKTVQRFYEGVASPLLYQPVQRPDWNKPVDNRALTEEPQKAARLYQDFFDSPIVEGERTAIVESVRNTWQADQAEAAWQAIDNRQVHLARQEVILQEHSDWADVELAETYQNQTAEPQEVIYYFNLPESAVLTGVWLGLNKDKVAAYSFQVAPRGAAQEVYREQTRIQKDPALLEQIGPRQYRLRVFPVPAMRVQYGGPSSSPMIEDANPMYMWLSWREMADGDSWPMPQLAFSRNVYWDESTLRLVNGQPVEGGSDEWLPESIPASGTVQPQAHRVDLPGGQTVTATPLRQGDLTALPDDLRIAVVIDRSRSMQAYAADVTAALKQLKALDKLDAPVDIYLTSSTYRGEAPSVVALDALDENYIIYYGGQNAAELLAQFASLYAANSCDPIYDAVLVLTDGSGYELGASEINIPDIAPPVWLVHMGGDIPLGYDDETLEAIQASGGGVAATLDEALARLAVGMSAGKPAAIETAPVVDLVDAYLWNVSLTGQAGEAGDDVVVHSVDDPFAALAARRLVLAEIQRTRGDIQVETLDKLHDLAKNYGIVTSYSSMIVLVNAAQQAMLERLSDDKERFQREFEALSETTAPGSSLPLAGVPEPHEWLLLGLAAVFLVYIARKRVRTLQI